MKRSRFRARNWTKFKTGSQYFHWVAWNYIIFPFKYEHNESTIDVLLCFHSHSLARRNGFRQSNGGEVDVEEEGIDSERVRNQFINQQTTYGSQCLTYQFVCCSFFSSGPFLPQWKEWKEAEKKINEKISRRCVVSFSHFSKIIAASGTFKNHHEPERNTESKWEIVFGRLAYDFGWPRKQYMGWVTCRSIASIVRRNWLFANGQTQFPARKWTEWTMNEIM